MNERTQPWLNNPGIIQLLSHIVDRLDRLPAQERTRPPSLRIDEKTMPAMFHDADPGAPEIIWSLIQRLESLGWVTIKAGRQRVGKAPYEVGPTVALVLAKEFDVRAVLGREVPRSSYFAEWKAALSKVDALPAHVVEYLGARPIRVPEKSAAAVIGRLIQIKGLVEEPLFLREVSGRQFWGHAKTLDRRSELIAHLLELPECPFPELPILIHSHCEVSSAGGILFVENEASFLSARVRDRARQRGLVLFFASGFKLAAGRLRTSIGSHLFHSTLSIESYPQNCIRIQNWLHGGTNDWPVYFWGDLDYASMEILKRLRQSFPNMIAWEEGYAAMVNNLRVGEGFDGIEVEGKVQTDPLETGCPYADSVLLPLLRESRLFCHQEQ